MGADEEVRPKHPRRRGREEVGEGGGGGGEGAGGAWGRGGRAGEAGRGGFGWGSVPRGAHKGVVLVCSGGGEGVVWRGIRVFGQRRLSVSFAGVGLLPRTRH